MSELNYHKLSYFFTENLLAIEMRKTDILMNKPVYLRFSILELSKILMYEFWYDYLNMVKKQSSVIWMWTVFIAYIKMDDIYKAVAEDAEIRFDTWNYELDKPLPKKVIWIRSKKLQLFNRWW